jgi:hypothetical protein
MYFEILVVQYFSKTPIFIYVTCSLMIFEHLFFKGALLMVQKCAHLGLTWTTK